MARKTAAPAVAAALVLALAAASATNGIVAAGQSPGASTAPSDVTFRIIVASTVESARALRDRVLRGAAFEELARSESIDPSAAHGGLIDPVALPELRPELRDAVAMSELLASMTPLIDSPNGSGGLSVVDLRAGRWR